MTKPFYHPGRVADEIAAFVPTSGLPPRMRSEGKELKMMQRKFCQVYVITGNAAKSARHAGYAEGNAAHQGHALLRNTKIRAYIHELRQKHALDTVWDMEDAIDKLESIHDMAITDKKYHAAVRCVEAISRIRMRGACQLNDVATRTLATAPIPEEGVLKCETDHIQRYTRTSAVDPELMEDMSPDVIAGPEVEEPKR